MKRLHVVGAVIVNDEYEVLCALRSADMSLGGFWEFPGGKMEAGETPQETLVREIEEELGCAIEVGDFVATCAHQYPTANIQLDTYFATIINGTPSAKEHERLEWISIKDLPTLKWAPADLPTVKALMKG